MVKTQKLLIVAILAIAFIAMAGMANARPADISVKLDKIQVNGAYIGLPTLLSSEAPIYGFQYTLVPDGTYTVFGTITNYENESIDVTVTGGMRPLSLGAWHGTTTQVVHVPASGTAGFTLTFWAPSRDDIRVDCIGYGRISTAGVEFVDMPDNTEHTVNQGPMSDAVAIFTNGVMNYNGKPAFMVGYGHL
jgi:hypothetical protein